MPVPPLAAGNTPDTWLVNGIVGVLVSGNVPLTPLARGISGRSLATMARSPGAPVLPAGVARNCPPASPVVPASVIVPAPVIGPPVAVSHVGTAT